MALDRWIALIIALVFLIYGHTAFFGMDDLLPPILKRNPIWPSTFPKILSIVGVLAAITVLLNFEKSEFTRKNQQLFTNGHFPAPYDPIGKTVTLTFQA